MIIPLIDIKIRNTIRSFEYDTKKKQIHVWTLDKDLRPISKMLVNKLGRMEE